MAHTKATPEYLRPSIDDLAVEAGMLKKIEEETTINVQGFWEQNERFEVKITGARCDVIEAVESLRQNPLLSGLYIAEVKEAPQCTRSS